MTVYLMSSKGPILPKQLRMQSYRYLVEPVDEQDPVWVKRFQTYWTRQERIYGMRLTPFTMMIDREEHIISSYAAVQSVMPGERTLNKAAVTFLSQGGMSA